MKHLAVSLVLLVLAVSVGAQELQSRKACRNVPGSAGYPTTMAWNAFNATISGSLVEVVPSANFCAALPCIEDQWSSGLFRSTIPGAMDQYNFEQDYDMTLPSLCLRNGTTCGQGNVPIYSVEAKTVAHIQAAVKFASEHNLRVAIKSSGHETLGRSTAAQSLVIRTSHFQNLSFTDKFLVGTHNMGPAVTATAGHSSLSPLFGLAADNVLEFKIVVATGELLTANSISHPDLFFALRGGGSGSWGVIVSVTFRTFPTLNATTASIHLAASSNAAVGALASVHAEHIFDLDGVGGTHSFIVVKSMALLEPFMTAALDLPGISLLSQGYTFGEINDELFQSDDGGGGNAVAGPRLIPAEAYRNSPMSVGPVYKELFDTSAGALRIIAVVVAGGKVAENANISSAVHPAWRTAKTHLVFANGWADSASLDEINFLHIFEPEFKTTFFGPNYSKLSTIKAKYDPKDLFIVGAGVGSERWDQAVICKV
ncbi:FAD-binding domain-containing protein [Mycena vulgaris]|nr:FAD-binding domain-containing protein [Mycena vulgaris]